MSDEPEDRDDEMLPPPDDEPAGAEEEPVEPGDDPEMTAPGETAIGGDGDPLDPSITGGGVDSPGDDGEPDPDAPLGDLAERARRSRDRDAADGAMDAFEAVDVDDVEADRLWAELEDEDVADVVDEPQSAAERDVRIVSKRDYCMRCQHFSAPPEVRCNDENGEIVELVDTEQFRVADCPILRGEEGLENLRRK